MTPQERLALCRHHAEPYDDEGALLREDVPWLFARVEQLEQALEHQANISHAFQCSFFTGGFCNCGKSTRDGHVHDALTTMPTVDNPTANW